MKIYSLLALIGLLALTSACCWNGWQGTWGRRSCCQATCAQYVEPATYTTAECPEYAANDTYANGNVATAEPAAYAGDYSQVAYDNGYAQAANGEYGNGEFEDFSNGYVENGGGIAAEDQLT